MRVILVVGQKKSGKTTLTKRIAKRILSAPGAPSLYVWDRNREWGARSLPSVREFSDMVTGFRNRLVIIEDATIHFGDDAMSKKLREALVTCRHDRNTFILLFHSLRSVPLWILEQVDGIALLSTKDMPGTVRRKYGTFPELVEAFERLRLEAIPYKHIWVDVA